MTSTPRDLAHALFVPMVFTRDNLFDRGHTRRSISRAVDEGRLRRLRRDRYAEGDIPEAVAHASAIGARLTCISLLQMLGVFVLSSSETHVRLRRNRSRFDAAHARRCRLHWYDGERDALLHVTGLKEAILHSLRCQTPRAAIATLDSVVHHGLMTMTELRRLFDSLPPGFRAILNLVDPTAESGPETFVRLMLRTLGVDYECQVVIVGVGRVDFVVDGWLIIECDSRAFHEGWEKQRRDRQRDLAAMRLGYVTVRPLASDVLGDPASVQCALRDVIERLGPRLSGRRGTQLRKNAR
ncbi:MAG: hypothetical protein IJG47_08055 [Microbacterium sp.]|nr:hypothetical protein [Microbacterium sp.]